MLCCQSSCLVRFVSVKAGAIKLKGFFPIGAFVKVEDQTLKYFIILAEVCGYSN